jgi:predicted nucleotidyltransferase
MIKIVQMQFGSHLYGTNTPSSDIDIKGVYLPTSKDVLLQRVKGSISQKRSKELGEKNLADEIDEEYYSLQKYLSLVTEGQTVAIDMLFCPDDKLTSSSGSWRNLIENRHRLISKKSSAFVGYCMQQAKKYGVKGSRVAALRTTLHFLLDLVEDYEYSSDKLSGWSTYIEEFVKSEKNEFIRIVEVPQTSGFIEKYLEVCGRKLQYTASMKMAIDVLNRLLEEYGKRALMAENNLGVDWKALSHAVRIAQQAVELFETGNVIFPRPNAKELLDIKQGNVPYVVVAEKIELLLEDVLSASAKSSLSENVDAEWIEDFLLNYYDYAVRYY